MDADVPLTMDRFILPMEAAMREEEQRRLKIQAEKSK